MRLSLEYKTFSRYFGKEWFEKEVEKGFEIGFKIGFEKGKVEGEKQMAIKIARTLLLKGTVIEEIAEVTNLSTEEVRKLKESI